MNHDSKPVFMQSLSTFLVCCACCIFATTNAQAQTKIQAQSQAQSQADVMPMLAQVPTYDEQAIAAKLLANAVDKQESLAHQQNVLTLRQLEAQNKHNSQLLEQEKLALERSKLALEQMRLEQQQQAQVQHNQRRAKSKDGELIKRPKPAVYQQVADIRLASIMTTSSGKLKAIFYRGQQRTTYLEGDQIFLGAQLIKVAANGVAIKLNEEVIFKYIN